MRILLVEDDDALATVLASGFGEQGHEIVRASSAGEGRNRASSGRHDVIILDVMLPGGSGFDLCRELRQQAIATPILMLTARDSVDDRVAGLDAGADDYLAKPFAFEELVARVRALVRRTPTERRLVFETGDLRFDRNQRRVWRGDVELDLSPKELALLELFLRRPGTVLTRSELLDGAWDMSFERRSNIVDVYVRSLREKVDRPFGRSSIETVRGIGYRLRVDE